MMRNGSSLRAVVDRASYRTGALSGSRLSRPYFDPVVGGPTRNADVARSLGVAPARTLAAPRLPSKPPAPSTVPSS
jgi:hypothetical protein